MPTVNDVSSAAGKRKPVNTIALPFTLAIRSVCRAVQRVCRGIATRQIEGTLLELSDHELKDIGITRGQIRYASEYGRSERRSS